MSKAIMYEQIYSDLLDKMKMETYPPGSRLPSEMDVKRIQHVRSR